MSDVKCLALKPKGVIRVLEKTLLGIPDHVSYQKMHGWKPKHFTD